MSSAEKLLASLRASRKRLMPTSQRVVLETWDTLGYSSLGVEDVRARFDELLYRLFVETLTVLEQYEQSVDVETLLPEVVAQNRDLVAQLAEKLDPGNPASSLNEVLKDFLNEVHPVLKGYFQSISQSRKTRGGKDFELQVELMLHKAAIPYEKQATTSRVDFLLPSRRCFEHDKPRGVVLSLKRTLRERWKQVAREIQTLRCPSTYLVTAEKIGARDVADIGDMNVYFVVWDEVKDESFSGEPAVVGFSQLIRDIVQHYMPQWPPECMPQ